MEVHDASIYHHHGCSCLGKFIFEGLVDRIDHSLMEPDEGKKDVPVYVILLG
jgi:hypothetical protein